MGDQINGPTLETLPEDVLYCIAAKLHEVGTPGDLYSFYLSLVPAATAQGASLAIASRIIKPWLYHKVDLDFAGAESVGTTQLLRTLFDNASDTQKHVLQLTVTIGPLVFRFHRSRVGRYLDYILKLIPLLPQLQTFRWNTPILMSLRILHEVRRHETLENLHVALRMRCFQYWRQLSFFKQAGLKRLRFTLIGPHNPESMFSGVSDDDPELSWTRYGLLHGNTETTATLEKLMKDDPFLSWAVENILDVEDMETGRPDILHMLPFEQQPLVSNSPPDIEEIYLDRFNFHSHWVCKKIQQQIDLSKLKLLELRNCRDVPVFLNYLVDDLIGGVGLKTIRIVGPRDTWAGRNRGSRRDRWKRLFEERETSLDAYAKFFSTYHGFEEIVIDDYDQICSPSLITKLGGPQNDLRRLELHFPERLASYNDLWRPPLEFIPAVAIACDVAALVQINHQCPNLSYPHLDLRLGETTHQPFVQALRAQLSIKFLSFSLPTNEMTNRAQAEDIATSIRCKPLRQLNTPHRPIHDAYITTWDRFGPDELWPARRPEESACHGLPHWWNWRNRNVSEIVKMRIANCDGSFITGKATVPWWTLGHRLVHPISER
ncbi:MAG: hypothetical protein Q9170_006145 [Blastenia crenularia]